MSANVLIVDDDPTYARTLKRALVREGHDVSTVDCAADALARFSTLRPEVVVLDYQLPDGNGLELMDRLRRRADGAVFLLNTAFPDLDVAVEAMRRGAFDFLAKDRELRECLLRVERAVEAARRRRTSSGTDADGMLGDSEPMRRLRSRLEALASSDDTTALITGETGTGKGLVARHIHASSGRAYEPFVALDCTTIPTTLVESELFGHERGAFSGATHAKSGRVSTAGRGTLFLDELGELDLATQAKLLRLLEEREYSRVGGTRVQHLEARVITATNRNIAHAVAEGRFRADLRYRLEVFVIEVPPLRDRGDDILLLTQHFANDRTRRLGRVDPGLSPELVDALRGYPFPGNVRELRNMVEQAVLLTEGDVLGLEAFPVLTRPAPGRASPTRERTTIPLGRYRPTPGHPVRRDLVAIRRDASAVERARIVTALEDAGGNVSAAARNLGMSRYQLLRRLTKHGLR